MDENLMKSSTTSVYSTFPDSEVHVAENGKYQICPDIETEQRHPIVNIISRVLLNQISVRKLNTLGKVWTSLSKFKVFLS